MLKRFNVLLKFGHILDPKINLIRLWDEEDKITLPETLEENSFIIGNFRKFTQASKTNQKVIKVYKTN